MNASTSDRPWPAPSTPWLVTMQWHDLLFAHWQVDARLLRPLIPSALTVDTFDGTAWVGVVPFWMNGIRRRRWPALPGLSEFPELNLRTYVAASDGRPGVWFFSLDAAHRIAVRAARRCYHLPYFDARMNVRETTGEIHYHSLRTHRGAPPAEFAARYRPTGPVFHARPGSFEFWLTGRYCLYAADRRGRVYRGEIDHAPWPLQPAEADIRDNTMTEQISIRLPDKPPVLHFAKCIKAVAWGLVEVR